MNTNKCFVSIKLFFRVTIPISFLTVLFGQLRTVKKKNVAESVQPFDSGLFTNEQHFVFII